MPRPGRDLFEKICAFPNLVAAYRLARRAGRGKPGPVAFDYDLEDHLWALRDESGVSSSGVIR